MSRKRKKKEKLRGKRSHGKGDTKNKRGAGSRGGRGKAGSHKHKYSKYYSEFGGKKQMKPHSTTKAINLDDLNESMNSLLKKGKLKKEKNTIVVDGKKLGVDKILARGNIEKKLLLKNIKTSKKAREKIINAGGTIKTEKSEKKEKKNEEEK